MTPSNLLFVTETSLVVPSRLMRLLHGVDRVESSSLPPEDAQLLSSSDDDERSISFVSWFALLSIVGSTTLPVADSASIVVVPE